MSQPWIVEIAEENYRYGTGPLRLRVDRVDRTHPVTYDGEAWLPVEGVQLTGDGVGVKKRQVLVRARALPSPR